MDGGAWDTAVDKIETPNRRAHTQIQQDPIYGGRHCREDRIVLSVFQHAGKIYPS